MNGHARTAIERRAQVRPASAAKRWRSFICACCATTCIAGASLDGLADDKPAPIPPFLSEGTGPNLIITIDDSTSMRKAYFGEGDWGELWLVGSRWYASPQANPLYYNPDTTYLPAQKADGESFAPENSLGKVFAYPFDGDPGCSENYVNLAAKFRPVVFDPTLGSYADAGGTCGPGRVFAFGHPERSPYYYEYNEDAGYLDEDPDADETNFVACEPDPLAADYAVGCKRCGDEHPTPGRSTPDPCFDLVEVANEDMANFVTWYKFYRTRLLTVKTVLTRVLQDLNDNVRVAYQGLSEDETNVPGGVNPGDVNYEFLVSRFAPYGGANACDDDDPSQDIDQKQCIFNWLFSLEPKNLTMLVSAHIRAGEFVSQGISLADGIAEHRLSTDPAADPPAQNMCKARCRKNFHLLFADGLWEDSWRKVGGQPIWPKGTGHNDGDWFAENWDDTTFDLPTTVDSPFGDIDYTPTGPYKDKNSGMLADAAFYYWSHDLVDSVANDVPVLITEVAQDSEPYDEVNFWNPNNDPADWQHLTLFTVLYGMSGGIDKGAPPYGQPPYGRWEEVNGEVVKSRDVETDGFPSCVEEPYDPDDQPWGELTRDDESQWPCPLAIIGLGGFVPGKAKADDLYHAALNSRGRFYEASAPEALIESFSEVLDTVSAAAEDESANAPVAINAGGLSDSSRIYQAVSSTSDWSGEIRVLRVSSGYGIGNCPDEPRGAFCEDTDDPYQSTREDGSFPAANERTIFTMADGEPAAFHEDSLFGELSERQKAGLTGGNPTAAMAKAYIQWLRGDDTPNTSGIPAAAVPEFRERETLLGDILGSGPIVVGPPRQLFPDTDYLSFKRTESNKDRANMVYVGANDGMLHAFRADSAAPGLAEAFAYIPEAVYDNLSDLANPAYGGGDPTKKAFVDGPLSYSDAKFTDSNGDGGWHSVLVGALGAGAQGIYALDVTDPSPTTANELVLWEFTDASGSDAEGGALDGRDMGYNLALPAIVRIDDNLSDDTEPTWVVLVGNGYASTELDADGNPDDDTDGIPACEDDDDPGNCTISQTGHAVLYVLKLGGGDDNRILARMDTGVGTVADPNGLMEVSTLDENNDLIADRAYAGDAFGNVWRFDLVDTTQPPTRIFQAQDEHGNPQPISSRIAFTRHPNGGHMLLFGTGRFINDDDKTDLSVQSFYGIWDDAGTVHPAAGGGFQEVERASLIQHEFLATVNVQDTETGTIVSLGRTSTTDENPKYQPTGDIRGWMIDLVVNDSNGVSNKEGERVVVAPQVRQGRVVFVSLIPGDCCDAGGNSWINALDALDGSRLEMTPFDFNLDGNFNAHDLLDVAGDPDAVGSSIRIGTGIYSAPSMLGMGAGEVMGIISDSEGDLMQLEESGAFAWRTWLQLQ